MSSSDPGPAGAAVCPLCAADGGVLILRQPNWRLIRADEAGFPAFYRVVWNSHVAEFSDLTPALRAECMEAVARVEQAVRAHLRPAKVNLAALGNMVPHLHWHVIARFDWDSHFPAPVWAPPRREPDTAALQALGARLEGLESDLMRQFGERPENCT